MDTQIFNQGLSVLAVSAYILIAALVADGIRPDLSAISARWNARPEELDQALAELRALNVVEPHPGPDGPGTVWLVNPASLWGSRPCLD
jgi:DNA-binding IscR family transcriptional regulator